MTPRSLSVMPLEIGVDLHFSQRRQQHLIPDFFLLQPDALTEAVLAQIVVERALRFGQSRQFAGFGVWFGFPALTVGEEGRLFLFGFDRLLRCFFCGYLMPVT